MRTTLAISCGLFVAVLIALAGLSGPYNFISSAEAASWSNNAPGELPAMQFSTATPSRTPTLTPTPSPTPRLVYLPSFPGNSSVNTFLEGTELFLSARMDNLEGDNSGNGEGIHHVDMYVFDRFGRLVDSHRENNYPYCYFQEDAEGSCRTWDFAQRGYRWPQGSPAAEDVYFARAVGWNATQDKVCIAEEAFWLDLSGEQQHVSMDIDVGPESNGDRREYVDALEFENEIFFDNDQRITRVSMFILAPDGRIVYQKDESNAPYCAFGDDGANTQCKLWDFRTNNDRWPGGEPIQRTMYIFRALAYSGDRLVGAASRAAAVRPIGLLPNPPQPNPPQPNPPSGNFAILANGSQDVSQVTGALVFRTLAGGGGVDGNNIDHVEMSVFDQFGARVHFRSEVSPRFCAFGGNETCNPLNFAGEGYRWSDGSAIKNNGTYTLRAVIYFRDGRAPLTLWRNVTIRF
ncbi:MAG: hypothetical protein IT331_16010 [Anaerolineae bacterium]|nr:hypothetical protein [Anaerolineae bacterium]